MDLDVRTINQDHTMRADINPFPADHCRSSDPTTMATICIGNTVSNYPNLDTTNFQNIQVGIGTTSPSSTLDVNGDMEIASGNAFYSGYPNTDGSWRIKRDGNNLVSQRRESGIWNTKDIITP